MRLMVGSGRRLDLGAFLLELVAVRMARISPVWRTCLGQPLSAAVVRVPSIERRAGWTFV